MLAAESVGPHLLEKAKWVEICSNNGAKLPN